MPTSLFFYFCNISTSSYPTKPLICSLRNISGLLQTKEEQLLHIVFRKLCNQNFKGTSFQRSLHLNHYDSLILLRLAHHYNNLIYIRKLLFRNIVTGKHFSV